MEGEGSVPTQPAGHGLLAPLRTSAAYRRLIAAVAVALVLVLAFNFYLPGPGVVVMPVSVALLALALVWAMMVRDRVERGEDVELSWPPPEEALAAAGIALVLAFIGTGIIKLSGA